MKNQLKGIHNFSDLQTYLQGLYGKVNTDRSWDYFYGYLVRSCGFMSVNAAKDAALQDHFIRAVSWLFTIANDVNINVTEHYVQRFPGACYYCISSPCVCHKTNKQHPDYIPAYKVIEERKAAYDIISHQVHFQKIVINYDWLKNNVSKIYPNNEIIWYHSGPWYHFTKLNEELAELHQVLSKFEVGEDNAGNLAQELADVFAWIIAIWMLAIPEKNLQDEFINHYYNGCPVCVSFPCYCSSRKERRSGIVALAELRELHLKVNDLATVLGSRQTELSDVRKSLEKAIESRNEQIAVQAVVQVKDKMENMKKTISEIDETGKKAASIIETATGLASKLLKLVEFII